jgi:hypothetical protein
LRSCPVTPITGGQPRGKIAEMSKCSQYRLTFLAPFRYAATPPLSSGFS